MTTSVMTSSETATVRFHSVRVSRLLGLILALLCLARAIHGQNPASDTGIHDYQTYDGAHEDVSLGTGNVVVRIPLLTLPGRNGHNYSVWLLSNSQALVFYGAQNTPIGINVERTGEIHFSPGGVVYPASGIQCIGNYAMRDENGGLHSFSNMKTNCMNPYAGPPTYQPTPEPQYNVMGGPDDRGEGITADLNACTLTMKDGTWYRLSGCPTQGEVGDSTPPVLEDSNGNKIADAIGSGTDTDTIGRTVTFTGTGSIQYKDSNGTPRTITVNSQTANSTCTYINGNTQTTMHIGVSQITSAILPNGLTYIFQYDQCGTLNKIVYPSGGYTRYVFDYLDYKHVLTSPGTVVATGTDIELVQKYVCRTPSITPGATSTGSGNTCSGSEDETTYAPTVSSSICNHSANTVIDPLANKTVYQFMNYTYCSYSALETSRQIYQGSSTLLRTVQTSYTGTGTGPYYPSDEVTILPNGLQTKTHWDYSGPANIGWVGDKKEYDWAQGAPGSLIRETDTPYQCNFKKASETIKNGSGTQIAYTLYEFDHYTSISPSGATQHDSAYGTSFTNRCNVTAVERWRNTDGATLITRMQYDDAGNVVSTSDPLGHVTTTSYVDSWGDSTCEPNPTSGYAVAYPTSITSGGLTTTHKYNSCSGTLASTTDPNLQTTSYVYDEMNRRTNTTFPPGGGSIQISYGETVYPLIVSTTQAIDASTNKTTAVVLDGIARPTETQIANFPGCSSNTGMKVDTTYDADGRKHTVSNPYCTTSDTTYGLTTYAYDGLNRVASVTHPDTSSTTSSYDLAYSLANCSEVTDENGNQHENCSNGIDQMIAVLEPNGSTKLPSMETDYCYDVLDDMTMVMQSGGSKGSFTCAAGAGSAPSGARVRSFTYDSLKELLTSSNPESGSSTYTYDNDGNVSKKTDARNISTNFSYDTLNRLIAKTYTNDTSGTPTPCYQYGTTTSNNQNGRLVNEWTLAAGSTCQFPKPSSGYLTARSSIVYDQMGRATSESQCTPANCGTSSYPMAYGYNLAGDINTVVDSLASNPFTLTYSYDTADHLKSLSSTWNDSQHPGSLFSTPVYQAFGLTSANLGTANTLVRSFNTRGFITNETDKTTGGSTVYSYSLSYYPNGFVNTGNDFVTGNWTYTPDTLNRVIKSVASSGSCNGMTITWSYDPWANRLNQQATGSSSCTMFQPNFAQANSNNTLPGYTYDADGNTLTDANSNTLTYDAEGRISTVTNASTRYIYDAEGRRVAKENSGTGAVTASYALSPESEQLAEMNGSGVWQHSNIFAMGKIYATYGVEQSSQTTRIHLSDWLGTRRVDVSPAGPLTFSCFSYPFGDGFSKGLHCGGSDTDITEQHFTGKERDSESGNDYFGARYYTSTMGRFVSPDDPFAVQDASDPQSWNLYSYARNNPTIYTDPDGHDVNVCSSETGGGMQCHQISNEEYMIGQGGNNGGLNVPTLDQVGMNGNGSGAFYATAITDRKGSTVGTATYVSDGATDYYANRNGLNVLRDAAGVVNAAGTAELTAASLIAPEILLEDTGLLGLGVAEEDAPVIGKMSDIRKGLRPGERELDLPWLRNPKADWAQNSSKLRYEMGQGRAIRDVSAGNPGSNTGFLKAERNLLQNSGWTLKGEYWVPPGR